MGIFNFWDTKTKHKNEIKSLEQDLFRLSLENLDLKVKTEHLEELVAHKEEVIKRLKEEK